MKKLILLSILLIVGCAIQPRDYIPVEKKNYGMNLEQFLSRYSDSELYYKDFAYTVVTRWEWIDYNKYLVYYQFKRDFGEHPQIESHPKKSKKNKKFFYYRDYSCHTNCDLKHIHFTNGLPNDTTDVPYIYRKYLGRPMLGAKCISELYSRDNFKYKRKMGRKKQKQHHPTYSCPPNCRVNHKHFTNLDDANWRIACLDCVKERTDIWMKNDDDACKDENNSMYLLK